MTGDPAERMPRATADVPGSDTPSLYQNRELSWLDFNDRVLAEARDPRNPLLERVRFLAITASNLDEFYEKRVAWLQRMTTIDAGRRTVDGMTFAEQLEAVRQRSAAARRDMARCWRDQLQPALHKHGIRVVPFSLLDAGSRRALTEYFMSSVYPVLTPLVVDAAHPFPFISGRSLSLALRVSDPRSGTDRFARVKVPPNRPRFVETGTRTYVTLEDLIAAHLDVLFPGVEVREWGMMRVLRSIELGPTDEAADDVLELVEREVERRRLADAVSLELSNGSTVDRDHLLLDELELSLADVVMLDGPLGLANLEQLGSLPIAELHFPPFTPAIPPAFASASDYPALLATLQAGDVLVHHPYESFDASVTRFIEGAAQDPAVLALKHTTYRTSPDSPVLEALIEAATRGKQVAVLVELTARLDEENNIEWARRLEQAGVHVAYGDPGRKIHGKISLIVRQEPAGVTLYGHIGTGNYNSRTARVYTDLGFFTADPVICGDLVRVFNDLTGLSDGLDTRALLVAPENLRSNIEQRIRREMEYARAGHPARLIFKMNALEDHDCTRLLYDAGRAGVQVDLVIRGISRIRPRVIGLSENVRVVSIIGRFLEHSRIFYFQNDGRPEYFIGSADLMKRNLDERIEVLTPVRDPRLMLQLHDFLEALLNERRQSWELSDRTWSRDDTITEPGIHETMCLLAPFGS